MLEHLKKHVFQRAISIQYTLDIVTTANMSVLALVLSENLDPGERLGG